MRLSPPGTHFTAESTEAMQIKYLAQGNNILLPGFEPSTSVTRNRHLNQTANMLIGLKCHIYALYLCFICIYIYMEGPISTRVGII